MAQNKVKIDPEELQAEIERLSRGPFQRLLADFLEASPDIKSIEAQAKKYPDRYMQGVTQAARLSGYTEKTEHTENHHLYIHAMSDSQLDARLKQLMDKMQELEKHRQPISPALSPPREPDKQLEILDAEVED